MSRTKERIEAKNWAPMAGAALLLVLSSGVAQSKGLKGRVVAADGEGAPAVVFVQGAPEGAVPQQDAVITHLAGGRFTPALSIGFVGNDFLFRNEDDTLHTTHLYLQLAYQKEISGRPLVNGATVYNIALPRQGMEVRRPIRPYHGYREDTGYIAVKCNPHPNEQAAVLVFDHPFAAVTGEDGEFWIPDLPAGLHEVWVWQDGHADKWQSVDIQDGTPTEVVIELESGP